MQTGRANQRGFSLIEILVVVSIIGLLSSIILSAMRTARLNGMDAAIRDQVVQLRNVMELERSESGTYSAIKSGGGWKEPGESCTGFSGDHADKAKAICEKITSTVFGCEDCLYFLTTSPDSSTKYSILAYLPGASAAAGNPRYLCLGSSGNQSVTPGDLSLPGCRMNP